MASRWAVSVAIVAVATLACKKTPPPAAVDAAPNEPTVVATAAEMPPPQFGSPFSSDAQAQLPVAEDPPQFVAVPSVQVVPGASGNPAPPADPFEAAIAAVRASAVGCFAGQPKGEYSGTISVVVTPAGNVSRVEASASVDDPGVNKCLEQAAQRSYPSTQDGKKLSIDVRVSG